MAGNACRRVSLAAVQAAHRRTSDAAGREAERGQELDLAACVAGELDLVAGRESWGQWEGVGGL